MSFKWVNVDENNCHSNTKNNKPSQKQLEEHFVVETAMLIICREHFAKEWYRWVDGELMCNPFVSILCNSNHYHGNTLRVDRFHSFLISQLRKDNVSKAIQKHWYPCKDVRLHVVQLRFIFCIFVTSLHFVLCTWFQITVPRNTPRCCIGLQQDIWEHRMLEWLVVIVITFSDNTKRIRIGDLAIEFGIRVWMNSVSQLRTNRHFIVTILIHRLRHF